MTPLYETAGAVAVGVITGAIAGVAPGPAAAMALLASLVTRVALPALQSLPTLEDAESKREIMGTFLIIAAWMAFATQMGQLFLRCAGHAVPFLRGAAITVPVIALTNWIHELAEPRTI